MMTMSTFSFAISPPLFRWNMRHIGNAQRFVTFHRSPDDVDCIGAKHGINRRAWPPCPAFNPVLPHAIVNRDDCCSVEIRKWRAEVEDPGLKKRFVRRHRKLLIDVVGDSGVPRLRHKRFTESLERLALVSIQKPERHIARPRFAGRYQNFNSAYSESQRT